MVIMVSLSKELRITLSLLFVFTCIISSATAHVVPEKDQVQGIPLPKSAFIYCQTDFPTTTHWFHYDQNIDRFLLHVIHHNGVKWMPVHRGTITVNDLQTIEDRAVELFNLGAMYTVQFHPERCKLIDSGELACHSNEHQVIGELPVLGYSFHNYQSKTRLYRLEFLSHIMSTSVTLPRPYGAEVLSQSMDYDPMYCHFQGL
jgi:hypothetical protein